MARKTIGITLVLVFVGLVLSVHVVAKQGSTQEVVYTGVSQEAVTFDSSVMEGIIRDIIDKPKGEIYADDLDGVTEMIIPEIATGELTGLEYCKNIEVICIWSSGPLDTEVLKELPNLRTLYWYPACLEWDQKPKESLGVLGDEVQFQCAECSEYTSIKDISTIAELTQLENLYLYHTELADITPLSKLTTLRKLWIVSSHSFSVSPLAYLSNLEFLLIEGKTLNDLISLSSITTLKEIHLYDQNGDIEVVY